MLLPYKCWSCEGSYCFQHSLHENHSNMKPTARVGISTIPKEIRAKETKTIPHKDRDKAEKTMRLGLTPVQPTKGRERIKVCPWCSHSLEKVRVRTRGKLSTFWTCPNRKTHKNMVRLSFRKSINQTGSDLEVVSDTERDIYREIEKNAKKELASKRDQW